MNLSSKHLFLALGPVSFSLFPVISYSVSLASNANTEFEFGGKIDAICRVNYDPKARSTSLDLSSTTRQKTNRVFIWCNTGQSNASTTYHSVNGGYLMNENGDAIPYTIRIPETVEDMTLTSAQTVSQHSGTGTAGDDKSRMMWVTPQVTGFESAGSYTDIIQITVSYN